MLLEIIIPPLKCDNIGFLKKIQTILFMRFLSENLEEESLLCHLRMCSALSDTVL